MANEKRLIDADELLEKIEYTSTDVCADYGDCFCLHGYSTPLLRLMVSETPTVDAVEVVHGRWIPYSTTMMECSICKRHTARHRFEYCPHCGAKMDGDGNV